MHSNYHLVSVEPPFICKMIVHFCQTGLRKGAWYPAVGFLQAWHLPVL